MNIAIVLSGGTGSRMGADIPKQYLEVNNRTIISYSLETLGNCESIDGIVVVAESTWHSVIENALTKVAGGKFKGFSAPGATRQLSIISGLNKVKEFASDKDIVLIHDAARPLVSNALLKRVIEGAKSHQGAMPVLPMKDTVYYSEDGQMVFSLLNRSRIYAGQAPEAFVLGDYYDANMRLSDADILKINGSTEPAILAGMDVVMVDGEEDNFKITTKEDLERYKQIKSE